MSIPVIEELAARRKAIGMSTREFERRSGYDRSLLQRWERGATAPRVVSLHDWAETLGLRLTIEEK